MKLFPNFKSMPLNGEVALIVDAAFIFFSNFDGSLLELLMVHGYLVRQNICCVVKVTLAFHI